MRTMDDFNGHSVITNIDVIYEQSSQFPTVSFCVSHPSKRKINIRDVIIGCLFELSLDCSWADFEEYSFMDETCFRFNSGKNYFNLNVPIKQTSFNDIKTGLILILKIDTTNVFGFKATLFVENNTNIFTRENVFNNLTGVLIPAGNSYVTVQREFVEKLDMPYNNCTKQENLSPDSKIENYFLTHKKTYTQKDCIDLCLKQSVGQECGCKVKSIDTNDIYKSCLLNSNETVRNCTFFLYENYLNNKKKFSQKCLDACPLECDSILFKISSNYLGSQTGELLKLFQNDLKLPLNLSDSNTLNDIVIMSIYYDDLKYTIIKQIPKTEWFDLVSNIGGTLGLCLGFSFLSLVELLELIYLCIYYLIKRLVLKML